MCARLAVCCMVPSVPGHLGHCNLPMHTLGYRRQVGGSGAATSAGRAAAAGTWSGTSAPRATAAWTMYPYPYVAQSGDCFTTRHGDHRVGQRGRWVLAHPRHSARRNPARDRNEKTTEEVTTRLSGGVRGRSSAPGTAHARARVQQLCRVSNPRCRRPLAPHPAARRCRRHHLPLVWVRAQMLQRQAATGARRRRQLRRQASKAAGRRAARGRRQRRRQLSLWRVRQSSSMVVD